MWVREGRDCTGKGNGLHEGTESEISQDLKAGVALLGR